MVKLPKYCWILVKYCKKINLQPNNHLPHHEPPASLITSGELEVHEPNSSSPLMITSSRLHEMNGTLFHRSRELVITRSRLHWNAALFVDNRRNVCSLAGCLWTAFEDWTFSPLLQRCLTVIFSTHIQWSLKWTFYLGHSKYFAWWWWWWTVGLLLNYDKKWPPLGPYLWLSLRIRCTYNTYWWNVQLAVILARHKQNIDELFKHSTCKNIMSSMESSGTVLDLKDGPRTKSAVLALALKNTGLGLSLGLEALVSATVTHL